MKLLIGTTNPGKLAEIRRFIGSPGFRCVSLSDIGKPVPEIVEDGATFQDNAVLKAIAYREWSGIPTVAEDAGMEIDALGGEPGVMSRRWPTDAEKAAGAAPHEKTDGQLIAMVLEKLYGVPWERRIARLRVVCAYADGRRVLTAAAAIEGRIIMYPTYPLEVVRGYPFRSLFWVPQFNKVYERLTDEEHRAVNHRREAYAKLRELIFSKASS